MTAENKDSGKKNNYQSWKNFEDTNQPDEGPETSHGNYDASNDSDDRKRAEIAEAIIKAKLHAHTEDRLAKLAERYNTSIDIIRDMFYDSACAVKFNTAKKIESEINRTFDRLKFTCHNKFKKREIVTLACGESQRLYDMISRVVVKQGKLKSDEVLLEFHIDDHSNNIVDGVFEITSEKVLNFEGFKAAFYKRFHYLPPIVVFSPKVKFLWDDFLTAISEHKQEVIDAPEDSEQVVDAQFVISAICDMPITTDDVEAVESGQAIHDHDGSYYVTTKKIKEITESLHCGFSHTKIAEAMIQLGLKYPGTPTHRLGEVKPRCWQFLKDAVEKFRNGDE
jgi:hypothetical protein